METKATGQNGPKSKKVNMKEKVVVQEMSKSLLAFAAHPIWKLDTKASKIEIHYRRCYTTSPLELPRQKSEQYV